MTIKELYERLLSLASGNENATVLFHDDKDFLDVDETWCLLDKELVVIELM